MNNSDRFLGRAVSYSKYRWDYADEAVQAIFDECGLSRESVVADIGSGTGKLTRHFIERVGTVFAVEPNPDMQALADEELRNCKNYRSVSGVADATTIPDDSVDMIVVGRALHWFPLNSTRAEFSRILKRDGWLAIFRVPCTDSSFQDSLRAAQIERNGWDVSTREKRLSNSPLSFYFGHEDFRTLVFPGTVQETWEAFLHRMDSLSAAPRPDHPYRSKLEEALHNVFMEYAVNGILTVSNATEVVFGRMH